LAFVDSNSYPEKLGRSMERSMRKARRTHVYDRHSFLEMLRPGLAVIALASVTGCSPRPGGPTPNIVLIYADDLGYGDVSPYGAHRVTTPNIDRLAAEGLRFTDAHATSATCTPSRYSLLTGEYAWRRPGTGIARGDAPAIIQPGTLTLPAVLKEAGYRTGVVGKWHLGLGPAEGADWNDVIAPGPLEIGFDEAFLIPATGDRVPCVFVEGHRVVGLDPSDPIRVSFDDPILDEPTGRDHPELLTLLPSHGHDQTIINGVSRIGYMSGGKAARWVDEEIADVITQRAVRFIEENRGSPFFLYFATHDIHVPRLPHPRFLGESGMGPRGDAIVEFDASVGEILNALDRLGLADETLVILTSDNGPVVDDGYQDQAVELLGDHRPAGPLRGGKYSAFDGGTRVPFVVRWPNHVRTGESDALASQIDLLASLAALVEQSIGTGAAPDSRDALATLLGRSSDDRDFVIEHAANGALSLIVGDWKYIEPHAGPRVSANTNIELGNDPEPQLYNLAQDLGEQNNLAQAEPVRLAEMAALLEQVRGGN
jgi:arylsulfatase A-like enzyme